MNYWDERYLAGKNSGYGSYDMQLRRKLKWLSGLEVNSISEIGCGDFNFGKNLHQLYPKASYVGQDTSNVIIARNKIIYPEYIFTQKAVPEADLLLCIDVLYHILDDLELEKVLARMDKYSKYLAVTAYEYDSPLKTHVRHKKFDFLRYGKPVIRKTIELDGDLKFYLWKK